MIKAEKLKDYDPAKFKPGHMSIKRNGVHGIFDPAMGIFYSRTPIEIKGLEHLMSSLEYAEYPVVGELTIPGLDFETASGKIRSFHSTPDAHFHIFNTVIPDCHFNARYSSLLDLKETYFKDSENIHIEPMYEVYNTAQFDNFYDRAIVAGEEGVCWISPEHIYAPGMRRWNWMKRVPLKSIEATIIDILPGTEGKKYEFSMGKMRCCMDDGKKFNVGIFKGQTDEWRQQIFNRRGTYIGSRITVVFKAYSKYGIPTQPRFKSFRWDL